MVDKSRGGNLSRRHVAKTRRQNGSDRTFTPDPVETARNDARESVKKFEKDFQEIGKALRK